jgi:hypothetical protein
VKLMSDSCVLNLEYPFIGSFRVGSTLIGRLDGDPGMNDDVGSFGEEVLDRIRL